VSPLRIAALLAAVIALACAGPGVSRPAANPPPAQPAPPIEIVPPPRVLPITTVVRPGSFSRSHVSPEGVATAFTDALTSAMVFRSVLDGKYPPEGTPFLELELAGSDYGEPDAYTLELQVVVLRQRVLLATYRSKQSVRQRAGSRRALEIGPNDLGALADRAIRDLVRQLAADHDNLAKL
jgi:hypothetical protein